ncbi:unnamed protein product [Paramecium octaurelia]|uniref:Uncharacterized protein n=1 Tax=Paramecium octaurelia TaxID=43137 RepID=A0A8S1VC22_PAROT|nr:unnamed protein product [Paramecium octaurelia]
MKSFISKILDLLLNTHAQSNNSKFQRKLIPHMGLGQLQYQKYKLNRLFAIAILK